MSKIAKIIAALLVTYTLVAGLLLPLGVGVYKVESPVAKAGEPLEMKIKAYNTAYSESSAIEARLRIDTNRAICATSIKVENAKELTIRFDIPAGKIPLVADETGQTKSSFPILEIYDKENGYSTLESAVFITNGTGAAAAPTAFCEVKVYPPSDKATFPYLNILQETIRNLYYHVPMWFSMMFILFMSVVFSIKQLSNPEDITNDIKANSFASVGLMFGLVGITTGALWAKHTWGSYWSFDVKQNTSAVALLIYLAYFVLRSSFDDIDKRARIAAIYNIFAFATLIPLLYIIPRMVDSLHPGATGNPGFNTYDLDSTMRLVFYPAIIGWIMMGFWFADLKTRIEKIRYKRLERE